MVTRIFFSLVVMTLVAVSSQAKAALVTISGTGTFGNASSISAVYQENAPFSFGFQVDSPSSDNPNANLYNAFYSVGGVAIATPVVVSFFDQASGGLFSLGFDNGGSLSFFGTDIGSTGTILGGTFDGAVFGSSPDYGSATIAVAAIPLPRTVMLFGLALVVVAVCRIDRRRGGIGPFHASSSRHPIKWRG